MAKFDVGNFVTHWGRKHKVIAINGANVSFALTPLVRYDLKDEENGVVREAVTEIELAEENDE